MIMVLIIQTILDNSTNKNHGSSKNNHSNSHSKNNDSKNKSNKILVTKIGIRKATSRDDLMLVGVSRRNGKDNGKS